MRGDFEHPTPAASWETRAYWEGCGRRVLVLQRCRDCGAVQHRPRAICAGCLSSAIEHFEAVLAINPDDAQTLTNLANALLQLQRDPETIEAYRQALGVAAD